MKSITFESIFNALKHKGHIIFDTDTKPYNLNIVGIRSDSNIPNTFNDHIAVFWKYQGQWKFHTYEVTTDPGLYYLNHPAAPSGTAILKEGQYLHSYKLSLHQGRYKALVQFMPVTVIHDFNRDNRLDFTSVREETGIFGFNIHRASLNGKTINVGQWSAGCQVFADSAQFTTFMAICEQAQKYWGKLFTYMLINSGDL